MKPRALFRWGLALWLLPWTVRGEEPKPRPIIAVFDVEDRGSGLDAKILSNLTTYLGVRLAEVGYQVVPQDQVRERLRAQQIESQKPCYDQSCQIELGRELSAQKSLSSLVIRLGDRCQVTAVLYDLKKSAAELAASAEAACDKEQAMIEAIRKIADDLGKPLRPAKEDAKALLARLEALFQDTGGTPEDRAERAWKLADELSKDQMLADAVRLQVLKGFLAAFARTKVHQQDAEQRLDSLAPGTLVLKSEPAGAWLSLDGKPAGQTPVVREVKGGPHQVELTLVGYKPIKSTVAAVREKQTEVALKLEPLPHHPYRIWGRVAFWTGVGCTTLGILALVPTLLMRNDFTRGHLVEDTVEDSEQLLRTFSGTSFGLLGSGFALMATGVSLWVLEPDREQWTQEWSRRHGFTVVPTATGNAAGLTLAGRW